MIRTCSKILAGIIAFVSIPVAAQMREIRDGAFTGVILNRAYLLYHVPKGKDGLPAQPIFMRMSDIDGLASDEPLFAIRNGETFNKGTSVRVYLLEVPPGNYLLYGLSLGGAGPTLATCFCLGTVSFRAQPGVVMDLGAFLIGNARYPSDFPELATETGFGPSIDTGFYHPVAAIRRADSQTYLPNWPVQAKIVRADFHAAGRFFDPRTTFVNRLAPLQGTLSYANGKPIDLMTGLVLPDHFSQ